MKLKVLATGSRGNSALVWQNEKCVILDAGVKFHRIKEAVGYQLDRIDFSLCTHVHGDHHLSVPDIINCGIQVIKPPIDDFESCEKEFIIGDWMIKAWDVEHDVRNWAYFLYHKPTNRRIAFMTDTSHSPFVPANCNALLMEISYTERVLESKQTELGQDRYKRLKQYHMGLGRALEFIKKVQERSPNLKTIVIMHMSDSNSDVGEIRNEILALTGIEPVLADKGTEVTL